MGGRWRLRSIAGLLIALALSCDGDRTGREPAPPVPPPDRSTLADGDTESRADEPGPTGAQPPAPSTDQPRTAGPVVPSDWPAFLDGLPPVDMSPRDRSFMELSRRIEKRGLKAMREDSFDAAVEHFFEAIEVDPGNVNARYNLSCALSRLGDRVAAVVMLAQLRDQGCGSCLGKVLKARRDPDFDPIRKAKSFVSVIADAEADLASTADTAMLVAAWATASKEADPPLALDPRRKVSVRVGCPTCRASKAEVGVVRGPASLRTWVERKRRAFSGGLADPVLADCKGKCCAFTQPDPATVSPDTLFLAEVCFRVEAGVATSLSKLALHRYPPPATDGP